jgi:hypothetical protein
MVPVGASTDAWALRQPFFSPILLPFCHCLVASATIAVATGARRADLVVGGGVLAHDPLVRVGVAGVAVVRADDAGDLGGAAVRRTRSSAR